MEITLNIALATAFSIVIYQDLKMRLIHIVLPITIFVLGITIKWSSLDWIDFGRCILFLLVNFLTVAIYFSLKKRKWVNPFVNMIGLGDLLFLIALTPFFSIRNYVIFFVLGMIFSLILHMAMKLLYNINKTIPLAGYLSIFMLGVISINTFSENNFL